MYGTSQARVEGTDDSNNLEGVLFVLYLGTDQCLLNRPGLSLIVSGPQVPGAGYYALVVGDFLVFDLNPVSQGTACTIDQTHAAGFIRRTQSPSSFSTGIRRPRHR